MQVGGAHWLSEAPAATADSGAAAEAAAEAGADRSGGEARSEGSIACNVVYTGEQLLLLLLALRLCTVQPALVSELS